MFGSTSNKSNAKSILTPVVSFTLLGVLVVGAVIFGNLVVERADECRPIGSPAEKEDGATLFVWSHDDDALMLCDVPQETVKYGPPQGDRSEVRVGEGLIRLSFEDDVEAGKMARIEGNDLTRDASRYPSEGYFSYERGVRDTPVYVKGEFGSLEDCGFFGEMSDYESDDFDGSDVFHPDRIQSCWLEIDLDRDRLSRTNGG